MSTYKTLLAISETHTRLAEQQANAAVAQKKAREDRERKAAEAREIKERQIKQQEIKKHFEAQRRKAEEDRKAAEAVKRQEEELERRERERMDGLRYGPKKAKEKAWPTSDKTTTTAAGTSSRKRKTPDDDDDGEHSGMALTRDEKRQRKANAEFRRAFNEAPRRSSPSLVSSFLRKPARKQSSVLPGGARNMVSTPSIEAAAATVDTSGMSVKKRLVAQGNMLQKLYVKPRDVRTIDEIARDLRASKKPVLEGDQARNFDLLAPTTKTVITSAPPTRPSSQQPSQSQRSTPPSRTAGKKRHSRSASPPVPAPKRTTNKQPIASSSKQQQHKATHRPSRSDDDDEADPNSISDTIWAIMGKKRSTYVSRDVYSDDDDDDIEADAAMLEREELRSMKIARREEREAEEAERRAVEEKRRRKMAMAGSSRG
ncbi:hypothetical protein C8F01DRAFT_1154615 [Mycena amicta]|nr:hypothetical protein C8F01DRAFT_1154615 [Mycena amicta]